MIVGIVLIATALGLILGPILASIIFDIYGYQLTFFIYAALLALFSIVLKLKFPTERILEIQLHLLEKFNESSKSEITFMNLLKIPRFTFAAFSGSLTYFVYSFMEPILAIRLTDFSLS